MGMIKNIAAYLIAGAFLFYCPCARAQVKKEAESVSEDRPQVVLKTDYASIEYEISATPIVCKSGSAASGCTVRDLSRRWNIIYLPSGRVGKIEIFITLKNKVIILGKYPKGTCFFDKILKHELTHVALGRGIVEKYAPEVAKAVLAKLDTLPQPLDSEGEQKIQEEFQRMFDRIVREFNRQDALIDGDANYKYQWDQAFKVCAEKERAEGFYPEIIVKTVNEPVRRSYSDAENGAFSSSFYLKVDFDRTYLKNIKKAYLTLGYNNVRIVMPSQYPPGSCRYNSVLRFAMTRIWLQRYVLALHTPEIRDYFASRLESLCGNPPEEEYHRLYQDMRQIYDSRVKTELNRADIRKIIDDELQKKLDDCLKYGRTEEVTKDNLLPARAIGHIRQVLKKPQKTAKKN